MKFTIKEDLIKRDRYLYLLAWDAGVTKNKKNWDIFFEEIFIQKIFVVLKLSAFCFEISNFSFPGCCISFILHLLQLVCGIQSMAKFYFTSVHLEFSEGGV